MNHVRYLMLALRCVPINELLIVYVTDRTRLGLFDQLNKAYLMLLSPEYCEFTRLFEEMKVSSMLPKLQNFIKAIHHGIQDNKAAEELIEFFYKLNCRALHYYDVGSRGDLALNPIDEMMRNGDKTL